MTLLSRTFVVCLIFLFCLSCKQENKTSIAPAVETTQAAQPSIKKTQKASTYQSSSSKRSTDQIQQEYPFDISLKDENGKSFTSDEILKTGKPTVVLFWLTTCGPCKLEMREIKKKYAQWEKEADFNLVAISTDFPKNYDNFSKMVKANQWPWPSYNDVNREFRNVMPGRLNGLPQSFVFDSKGEIVYHKRKYRMGDEDKLFAEVKALM